jgi:glutathione S-transferase
LQKASIGVYFYQLQKASKLLIKELSMIKLYGLPVSNNISKVRYCLSYLGLDYEIVPINPMKGENKTDEYLRISPTGKIPAIDADGFTLFESNAINRYLATTNNSELYPTDPKKRAKVDSWLDFGSIHIGSAQGRVTFNRVFAPVFGTEVDEASLKQGLEFLDKFLPIVEKQLAKSAYIAGDTLSIADLNLLAIFDPFELASVSLEAYPSITKWRNELKSADFYQKCYKDFTQFVTEAMSAMSAA